MPNPPPWMSLVPVSAFESWLPYMPRRSERLEGDICLVIAAAALRVPLVVGIARRRRFRHFGKKVKRLYATAIFQGVDYACLRNMSFRHK